MTDETPPKEIFYVRIRTLNGLVFDAQTPLPFSAYWRAVKADGGMITGAVFVPFDAIASIEVLDMKQLALGSAQPAGNA